MVPSVSLIWSIGLTGSIVKVADTHGRMARFDASYEGQAHFFMITPEASYKDPDISLEETC